MTSSKEKACCEKCLVDRAGWCNNLSCPCHKEREYEDLGDINSPDSWKWPSTPETEERVPTKKVQISNTTSIQEFSGATFEQPHEHKTDRLLCVEEAGAVTPQMWDKLEQKTEEWEQEFARRFLDYFDDGSKSPNIKPFHEIRDFISTLILKAKDEGRKEGNSGRRMYELGKKEGYDKGVAEWYKDEEYERGKKEERESLAAEYDENSAVILVGPTDNRRMYFSLKSVEFQEKVAKKEERERILAVIDSLPDLKPEGTHKWIDAHTLVCAIQEQEKKEE